MSRRKRLVLIDGKSVFYRGYYAMPNLATRDGVPTGGVYGFAMMALEVLKKLEPDYVMVAWDKPKTNIAKRRELYPEYKANRKPAPPDFYEQIPYLEKLLDAFKWPFLEVDNYEADDIIGTLAMEAKKQGIESFMVTSDQDVLQLVNDHVHMYALKKGLTDIQEWDEAAFKAEYGFDIEYFVDYKALRGDSSDNIPGVAGVGEKTAKELVQQYGDIDNVYKHLDDIKPAVAKKLEADKDMAYLSKELVTIMLDAPVELDLKAADVQDGDPAKIVEVFDELSFRRLVNDLPPQFKPGKSDDASQPTSSSASVKAATLIQARDDLEKLKLKGDELFLYTLTEQPEDWILPIFNGFVIGNGKETFAVLPGEGLSREDVAEVGSKLISHAKSLVGYNLKTDLKAWMEQEKEIEASFYDVMVAAQALNPLLRDRSLTGLSVDFGGPQLAEAKGESRFLGSAQASLLGDGGGDDDMAPQAAQIIQAIATIHAETQKELKKLKKLRKLVEDIEFPFVKVLADMEFRGITLDKDYLKKMSTKLSKRVKKIEEEAKELAKFDFNLASPSQLANVLFDKLALPTKGIKKTKSGYSTAASELEKLKGVHPIIELIMEYRELSKLLNTYIDPLPLLTDDQSKIHTTFTSIGSQTGRISSDHPNLMNIPIRGEIGREVRHAFVPSKGSVFVGADYSQFELRLAAVLAGDENMIKAFNDGADIHRQTAAEMYDKDPEDVTKEERYSAKAVNFGVMYGMGAHGLSIGTGMSHEEAQEFIERYFQLRSNLLDYLEGLKRQAKDEGYVETMFGRRRPMPDIKSSNFMVRSAAERAAMNMPIQGTEADLMKMAMINVAQKLPNIDEDAAMLVQVHDSILIECSKSSAGKVSEFLKKEMEDVYKLDVKLDVDVAVGEHWGEV